MKTKNTKTTAARLLDLVFEGHEIRTVIQDGQPLACAKDIATAIGLSKYRDAIAAHLDPDEIYVASISTGHQIDPKSRARVTQEMTFLAETGIAALVMCSRKPAARRFRRWMLGEVLPQLIQYGTFIPGITREQRLTALGLRYRQELAAQRAGDAARVAVTGWLPFSAYWAERGLPVALAPLLASRLEARAIAAGIFPERLRLPGQKKNPVNTWPRPLLELAESDLIPRLACDAMTP